MRAISITSHSEAQTQALAEKLVASFSDNDVIVLSGQLGAGKTVFVRGLAAGRGLDPDSVNSPSFTFVNEYNGEKPLFHFDLYRLGDISELHEIGWDEYLGRDGLMVVEWGEKAERHLPLPHYRVQFKVLGAQDREIILSMVNQ